MEEQYPSCHADGYGGDCVKELRHRGLLQELDESDEVNACTIRVRADVNGKPEDWLLLFKNETHNHPTEIEPFGGAATCLGDASVIRCQDGLMFIRPCVSQVQGSPDTCF